MKRYLTVLIVLIAVVSSLLPVDSAQAAPVAPGLTVRVLPGELRPAQAGFVTVSGGYPLEVRVRLDDKNLPVYWTGEVYLALFSFGFNALPAAHHIQVEATDPATGERLTQVETVRVVDFQYPKETVSLPYKLIPLLNTELNEQELAKLNAIYALRSAPGRWGWPFGLPVADGRVTSRFGGDRSYNRGMWYQYHTGVDFRGEIGTPVLATADGRVAAADFFDVRGNVVIIDHGYGVFSQYAHLSETMVSAGQPVIRGQLIGLGGATGRTNGPHLHFEIIVNGQPVDPLLWMGLSPSFVPPPEVPLPNTPEEGTGDSTAESGEDTAGQ